MAREAVMEVGSGVEERDVTYSTEPHSVIRDARVSRDSILSALVVDWPILHLTWWLPERK